MEASALIKFSRRRSSNGKALHWGRIAQDGVPFRGNSVPLLKQDEYDERVVMVADAHNGYFDTQKPEENKAFLQILDAAANGWYKIVHLERFVNKSSKHYVEWLEYYMEDGATRMRHAPPLEYRNGPALPPPYGEAGG